MPGTLTLSNAKKIRSIGIYHNEISKRLNVGDMERSGNTKD